MKSLENDLKEGETLFADGKFDESEEFFLSVVEKVKNNKEVYNNLGVLAIQKEDVKSAIEYFTRSLEIDPFYKTAIINYTDLLKTINQLHIAVPLLEKIAEINPNDEEIIQLLEDIRSNSKSKLRIAILCFPEYESFMGDIVNFLRAEYEVRTCYTKDLLEIVSAVNWADIVWLEWANGMAAHVTQKIPSVSQKKVICRIHSYEVLEGCLPHIEWSKVNATVFVADHVKNTAYEIYPSIADKTECIVINNGVDLDKFSFGKRKPGFNLAVVGDINNKKNPAMWIEIMSRLVNINPQYKLNVAGDIQEIRFKYYLENIIHRLGLERNIRFHGRVEDIPAWFEREKISYLLTTSVFESFGYSIAEAMAMGYKPLIHNFPSAYDNWPSDCIFNTTDELINIIQNSGDYDSKRYHNFVKDRYSLSLQLHAIDIMLKDMNKECSFT